MRSTIGKYLATELDHLVHAYQLSPAIDNLVHDHLLSSEEDHHFHNHLPSPEVDHLVHNGQLSPEVDRLVQNDQLSPEVDHLVHNGLDLLLYQDLHHVHVLQQVGCQFFGLRHGRLVELNQEHDPVT
jgi:hypothetical protein